MSLKDEFDNSKSVISSLLLDLENNNKNLETLEENDFIRKLFNSLFVPALIAEVIFLIISANVLASILLILLTNVFNVIVKMIYGTRKKNENCYDDLVQEKQKIERQLRAISSLKNRTYSNDLNNVNRILPIKPFNSALEEKNKCKVRSLKK